MKKEDRKMRCCIRLIKYSIVSLTKENAESSTMATHDNLYFSEGNWSQVDNVLYDTVIHEYPV